MQSATKKLLTENSIMLIKIPDDLYSLIDSDCIGEDPPSAVIGDLVVIDDNHVEIKVNKDNYYNIMNGPHPDSVQTSFTAKIIDSTHRNMFVFTETEGDVRLQTQVSLSANLVPNVLDNFNKFDPTDPNSYYGSLKKGAIVKDIHESKEHKNVVFSLGKGEDIIYGTCNQSKEVDSEEQEDERIRLLSLKKLKMDNTVLKQEIIKLFRKKEHYTVKEIQYILGQSDSSCKKALREVAEYERVGKHKCYWKLKKDFIIE